MTSPLHVISRVQARPGMRDRLLPFMLGLLEPTRREPGCLRYELLQSESDPDAFVFVEEWADDVALLAHLNRPDVRKAFDSVGPYVAESPALTWYRTVEPEILEYPIHPLGPAPH